MNGALNVCYVITNIYIENQTILDNLWIKFSSLINAICTNCNGIFCSVVAHLYL